METIDFRCEVRFLNRQRLEPPLQLSKCVSLFLSSLQKDYSTIVDNRCIVRLNERCGLSIIHVKRDEGFESDSEYSDSYATKPSALEKYHSLNEYHSNNSSGVNSSSSDIEETDLQVKCVTSPSDFLVRSSVIDILACHNPPSFPRVVLFTLRCSNFLEIVAVECGTEEPAFILANLCQKLCRTVRKESEWSPSLDKETDSRTTMCDTASPNVANRNDSLSPVPGPKSIPHKRSLVSIQSWSQRNGKQTNSHQEVGTQKEPTLLISSSKTQDMIRRLDQQISRNLLLRTDSSGTTRITLGNENANMLVKHESCHSPTSGTKLKLSKSCSDSATDANQRSAVTGPKWVAAEASYKNPSSVTSRPFKEEALKNGRGEIGDRGNRNRKGGRTDSYVVSLQTPDMPLPTPSDQRLAWNYPANNGRSGPDIQCVKLKSETQLATDRKKPGKIDPSLTEELEVVLQAKLAERQSVSDASVKEATVPGHKSKKAGKNCNAVGQKPAQITEGSNKVGRDKSKSRSFLFKFTSNSSDNPPAHSECSADGNGKMSAKQERGRSLLRRGPVARAPSQPPSLGNHHGPHTFLVPTKSGNELSRNTYPKESHFAPGGNFIAFGVAPPAPHPIFLSGHGPFPVRLTYPRGFGPIQHPLPPWIWTTTPDTNNNQPASHMTYFHSSPFTSSVDELKRLRSRSQSPGRRILSQSGGPLPNFAHSAYHPISLPITSALTPTSTCSSGNKVKLGDTTDSINEVTKSDKKSVSSTSGSKCRMATTKASSSCKKTHGYSKEDEQTESDLRKVTFNAFATVQLMD